MLTMRIDRTSFGLAMAQVFTSVRYDVSVPASSNSCKSQDHESRHPVLLERFYKG